VLEATRDLILRERRNDVELLAQFDVVGDREQFFEGGDADGRKHRVDVGLRVRCVTRTAILPR